MSAAALYTWILTVLAGFILLVIWLMEYDRDFQTAAATRLPVPLISSHALLGVGGLMAWGFYLVTDGKQLAWVTVTDLGVVAVLGLVMAARWIGVYRAYSAPGSVPTRMVTVPPERHFPRPVIVIHGVFAVTTLVLVLFTVVFTGGLRGAAVAPGHDASSSRIDSPYFASFDSPTPLIPASSRSVDGAETAIDRSVASWKTT